MSHGRNSFFGNFAYVLGKHRTPDAAYFAAWAQFEERKTAVDNAKADKLKGDAAVEKIHRQVHSCEERKRLYTRKIAELQALSEKDGVDRTEELLDLQDKLDAAEIGQAEAASELIRQQAFLEQAVRCYQKAVDEQALLLEFMNNILPYCKYKDEILADPDMASELAVAEEWLFEWLGRAEVQLATTGSIAADHLESAMCHPLYEERILPHIQTVKRIVAQAGGPLPDELLVPNNIMHLLEEIMPSTAWGRMLEGTRSADALDRVKAFGAERSKAKQLESKFKPNPENLLPALKMDEKHIALPMNVTPEDLARVEASRAGSAAKILKQVLEAPRSHNILAAPEEAAPQLEEGGDDA